MNLSGKESVKGRHIVVPSWAADLALRHTAAMRLALVALVWLATLVRFHGLFANTFHADEALFASWARSIAVWRDPLLLGPAVDKPPLLFYLQALFFPIMGTPDPWVARLPNLLASLLLVPLAAQLVWRLYRDRWASMIAALFVAFSPLAVQFSASAFTDPLLTFFVLGALVTAGSTSGPRSRAILAGGLLFGLAVATKHQAWLFLPLLVGLFWLRGWDRRSVLRWITGASLPLLGLLAWDLVRDNGLSLWSLQMQSYGGLRLAWSWELWSRLEAWGRLWQLLWGSPILLFFLILGLPLFLALLISEQDWPTAYDQLFVVFVGGYMLLHWFIAVPVWDRYLLPLIPLVGLLLGRFVSRGVHFLGPGLPFSPRQLLSAALLALFLLLAPPAYAARQGTFAVGAQPRGIGAGVNAVAGQLQGAPYGTVLYDHWFSWQFRYHLFDSGVYVSWFPHPTALVEDLQAFGHDGPARYLALPAGDETRPVTRALTAAGFALETVHEAEGVVLYRLEAAENRGE